MKMWFLALKMKICFVNSKKSTYSIELKFYHVIKHKICRRLVPVASLNLIFSLIFDFFWFGCFVPPPLVKIVIFKFEKIDDFT